MSETVVKVREFPDCDICQNGTKASYDGRTKAGPWGYLCAQHFRTIGVGLGLGKGQRLELYKAEKE